MRSEPRGGRVAATPAPLAWAEPAPAVEVTGLSKTYRVGELLRLERTLATIIGRRPQREQLEALRGVSFTVRRGECFGIVGTNGSGKSTILQILAGVTRPSGGEMIVHGSVLPMLAVGAGFHPELTGRENSFLFGTILGLSRAVVQSRLEDIARFAELEQQFDTPMKRYSSGMQSRLCFAIAMLFPADIYCFDEVLAVVDGEFRDRCLDHIRALVTRGSSVLFISHDLDQVAAVCDRVLWLERGEVQVVGTPDAVLSRYATARE